MGHRHDRDHDRAAPPLDLAAVPDHDGRARLADDRFFGPAPPAGLLGQLTSASTTCSRRAPDLSRRHRLTTAAVGMVLGFCLAVTAQPALGHRGWPWPLTAALVAGVVAFVVDRRAQACSYVGTAGVWLVTRGPLTRRVRTRAFRFAEATRAAVTRTRVRHHQGVFVTVEARFTDRRGRIVFALSGGATEDAEEAPARPTPVTWAVAEAFARARADALCAGHRELPGAVLDELVASGKVVAGIALERLFAAARWVDVDELAGTASAAGQTLDPLRHAWALLELADPASAAELDDGSARFSCVRGRAALARGDLDRARVELEADPADAPDLLLWSIATADLLTTCGDDPRALALLRAAVDGGYPLTALCASDWPSARLARQLAGTDGPYR